MSRCDVSRGPCVGVCRGTRRGERAGHGEGLQRLHRKAVGHAKHQHERRNDSEVPVAGCT
eukprot:2008739-Lingulodinium_polyedra.AAC.1